MARNQFELLRQRRFLPFFVTQCLGAFNDNVYRQAIIGLLFWMGVPAEQRTLYSNLAPALFILPYFLFSAPAGQIAEKLEKARLVRITTALEIAVMMLAAVGFLTGNLPLLLVALFGTGVQSTLFGPVKYSILPAVLRREELTGGNGLVEMGTSVSILFGMIVGGLIFAVAGGYGPVAAALLIVALAVLGNVVSRMIPVIGAAAPELKLRANPLPESLAIWRLTGKQPAVRKAVLGVSWFWFIGTVLTAQLPSYAEINLGGRQELYIVALALFSVGTGVGSLLCERLSGRVVEIGLVPLGAAGISVFLLDLYFARSSAALTSSMGTAAFLAQPGSWRIVVDLTMVGVFVGFFVVPLFALIQSRTPPAQISRVIAGMNIQNSLFVVIAAALGITVQRVLGWTVPQVFLALAIANTLVAIYIFTIVPEFAMRFVTWLLVSTLYRLRVQGVEENVPEEGPAIVVCNHVSYLDALILGGTIKRPVRFVMYYKIFNIPGPALDLPHREGNSHRGREGAPRPDAARLRRDRCGLGGRPGRRHLPGREPDPRRRHRAIPAGYRAHSRSAPGTGAADGVAGDVEQHVEPQRFQHGPRAVAPAIPCPDRRGGGPAARRRRHDGRTAGGGGARAAWRRRLIPPAAAAGPPRGRSLERVSAGVRAQPLRPGTGRRRLPDVGDPRPVAHEHRVGAQPVFRVRRTVAADQVEPVPVPGADEGRPGAYPALLERAPVVRAERVGDPELTLDVEHREAAPVRGPQYPRRRAGRAVGVEREQAHGGAVLIVALTASRRPAARPSTRRR